MGCSLSPELVLADIRLMAEGDRGEKLNVPLLVPYLFYR